MQRIGNLVQHKDFGKVAIYGLNPDGVQILFEDIVYLCEWDELVPIKMTEEILLSLQSVVQKTPHDFYVDEFLLLSLEDGDFSNPAFDVYFKGKYLTCIEYLHQLQNLYHSLTNRETK